MPSSISPSISRRLIAAYPSMTQARINALLRESQINTQQEFDAAFTLETFATLYGATYEA